MTSPEESVAALLRRKDRGARTPLQDVGNIQVSQDLPGKRNQISEEDHELDHDHGHDHGHNRTVYVANLEDTTSKSKLRNMFCEFGDIERVVIDREDGEPSVGMIVFESSAGANSALSLVPSAVENMEISRAPPTQVPLAQDNLRFFASDPHTIYVSFQGHDVVRSLLQQIFCEFGVVNDVKFIRDSAGYNRAAFLSFHDTESASNALAAAGKLQVRHASHGLKVGAAKRNTSLLLSGIDPATTVEEVEKTMSNFGKVLAGHTEIRHSTIAFVSFETREEAELARQVAKIRPSVIPDEWNVRWSDWPILNTHVRVAFPPKTMTEKTLRSAFSTLGVVHHLQCFGSHGIIGFECNDFGQFAALEALNLTQIGSIPVGCTLVRLRKTGHHSPTFLQEPKTLEATCPRSNAGRVHTGQDEPVAQGVTEPDPGPGYQPASQAGPIDHTQENAPPGNAVNWQQQPAGHPYEHHPLETFPGVVDIYRQTPVVVVPGYMSVNHGVYHPQYVSQPYYGLPVTRGGPPFGFP